MVFYRRQDARSAIKSLSGTKDINLASTSPESRYSYSDVWTKAESMEESAVTLASDVKGTLPMQETYHRAFLSPLPRMEDRELLEGMVRDVFHGFKM